MEIVYYFDEELKYCPVKRYLQKYLLHDKNKTFDIRRKQKNIS